MSDWEIVSLELYKDDECILGDRTSTEEPAADISFSMRVDADNSIMVIEARFSVESLNCNMYCCNLVIRGYFDCAEDASVDDLASYARDHAIARIYDRAAIYLQTVSSFGMSDPLVLPPFSAEHVL